VQQLSLLGPQFVIPGPPGPQLGAAVHAPLVQSGVAPLHPTALPHCPFEPQVCTPLPEH